MSKNLIFFGSEDFSLPTLQKLIDGGYKIEAVITKPDSKKGRGRKLTAPKVKNLAQQYEIPVLQPKDKTELVDLIEDIESKIAVLVSYGIIIPKEVINHFEKGIVNLHPSFLPAHRGPSPIESSILAGDDKFGLSIMQIDEGMDTGPVYSTATLHFASPPDRIELSEKAADEGSNYLLEDLPDIIKGSLRPHNQKTEGVSTTSKISKKDGLLDRQSMTADYMTRHIRAYLGWPGSKLDIDGKKVTVTKAEEISATHTDNLVGMIIVDCKDNTKLKITRLKPEGKKEMSSEDYLRGIQN